jgi:hypothetical protein
MRNLGEGTMRSRVALTLHLLEYAYRAMADNVAGVTLEEALFVPVGGYRSILGTLKHAAGWSHVYQSYAFDREPQHWQQIDWPHGRRDTIIKSEEYVHDVISWLEAAHQQWIEALSQLEDEQLEELRPAHWGERLPLYDIVVIIARHHLYHAGEINQVLSICRGEAWEEGEEVEENNVSTLGHRVVPPWRR